MRSRTCRFGSQAFPFTEFLAASESHAGNWGVKFEPDSHPGPMGSHSIFRTPHWLDRTERSPLHGTSAAGSGPLEAAKRKGRQTAGGGQPNQLNSQRLKLADLKGRVLNSTSDAVTGSCITEVFPSGSCEHMLEIKF